MAYSTTYITGAQVKALTKDTVLAAEEVSDLEAENGPIHMAEIQIDRFCGYWKRYGGQTQTRVFPRIGDVDSAGSTVIPEAVLMATLFQIEHNFVNQGDLDHGIEEDDAPKDVFIISPRSKQVLKGYVMKGGHIEFESDVHTLL